MIEKNKIINLEIRGKIYSYIEKYPGKYLREISREINIPKSTVTYHLRNLEKRELIVSEEKNSYKRYFISGKVSKRQKNILCLMRQTIPQNLLFYLFVYGMGTQSEIIKNARLYKSHPSKIGKFLNKDPTDLAYHLKKLLKYDLIEVIKVKNEKRYRLKDPEEIIDLIIAYKDKIFLKNGKNLFSLFDCCLKDYIMKQGYNYIFDIFPHPYHV
jgi:predicted transcriptional regulator